MAKENIIEVLRKQLPYLKDNYNVKSLGLFGSFIKGTQKKGSDVDVLVEFSETIDLIEFVNLESYLNKILGKKVDLVMRSALKPRIGKHILKEVRYVWKRGNMATILRIF